MPAVRRLSWLSVITIGSAVGLLMAATAVADSVLGSPFAGSSADGVVAVFARHLATDRERELTSFAVFQDWKTRTGSFEQLSGYTLSTVNLVGDPAPRTIRAAQVTADFFDTLNTAPVLGRGFAQSGLTPDPEVCVISDGLWRSRFGANPSIVGSVIHVDAVNGIWSSGALTVVGVMPGTLRFPERVDLWTPLALPDRLRANRSGQWFGVVGHLRRDVSSAAAAAEMSAVMAAVQAAEPKQQPAHDANLVPIVELLTARYRALVVGLVAAAGVLLLVVSASAGGLLAAGAIREHVNDRIRLSLGAGARRLIADAARDGVWLGIVAFVPAVPVAFACSSVFGLIAVELFDTASTARISWLSAVTGLACATLVSTALAVVVKAHSLAQARKAGPWPNQASVGGLRATTRLRSGLIVGEIALSVVLLATAIDLLTRVQRLRGVDLGFDVNHVLTTRVALPPARYTGERSTQFYESLIDRIRAVPSVTSAAVSSDDPLFGVSANPEFTLQFENRELAPDERLPILVNGVTERYFDVLGLRVLDGQAPKRGSADVLQAAINETLAARLFPHERPLGRRFRFGGRNPPWWTIVGVIADARNDGPLAPPRPTAYLSYPAFGKADMTLLVKTTGEVNGVVNDIRAAISELDPNLPIARIASARDLVEARFASLHIGALVVTALAATALMLSGLGLYGVLAAISALSRAEIGVRIALGAGARDMIELVLGRAVRLVAIGLLIGAACTGVMGLVLGSAVATQALRTQHILAIIATVAVVGLIAAAAPAWHATRVSPAETLRTE